MMEGRVSDAEKKNAFTNIVFSWSLEKIFNENLYLNQVLDLSFSCNYVCLSIGFVVLDRWHMIIMFLFEYLMELSHPQQNFLHIFWCLLFYVAQILSSVLITKNWLDWL